MHDGALVELRKFAEAFIPEGARVAEIGAKDVNGNARAILSKCKYVGFDIEAGPGVNVVLRDGEQIESESNAFDVVISMNTLEHTRRPWVVVQEMARILKPGGLMFLLVPMPNAHRYHAHPIDCWRCYTEGMRGFFQGAGIETVNLYEANDHDTVGIGRKP